MTEIRGRFREKITRVPGVASFRFSLPQRVDFLPGQFLQVIFDQAVRGNKELNKYLSISSSPQKEYLEVTKRLSDSAFSRSLDQLQSGEEVLLKLPMGECVFKDDYKSVTFLIGGIGITPVISIIEYIADNNLATEVNLFYSNRTEKDIAFRGELDRWRQEHRNINIFYTVTDCQPQDSACGYGFIDEPMLKEKVCDLSDKIVYIFGPPKMVDAMYHIALGLACKKENLKIERFIGY